jgi:sucrose-6-phosphate hydrolase SacC (GH32 family)
MNRFLVVAITTVTLGSAAELYREQYRPQFHFSPKINWTNDPCGIVFANGEYHLFFQFNPFGDLWGHMSWGHAVSRDMIHWKELPVAIPEGSDAMIYTGSSVVDGRNSSGLCKPGPSCIVSIYTGNTPKAENRPQKQAQHLAVSHDGRTWVKYEGNPVLDIGMADFRDPKVFWHEPSKQWVMIVVLAREKKASLYGSPDLKKWTHLSDFGPEGATDGVWECPDLYQLPIEGSAGSTRWVLKIGLNPGHIAGGSGEQYFVGDFDGKKFHNSNPTSEIKWLDYGRDCYCALTWNGENQGQGRHMIGWMNNWQYARAIPTAPWRGAMTLPRTLSLRDTGSSLSLVQTPVPAMRSLRGEAFTFDGKKPEDLNRKLAAWQHLADTYEFEATIKLGSAKQIAWNLLERLDERTSISYDMQAQQLSVDRTMSGDTAFHKTYPSKTVAPLKIANGELKIHVFVDRSSVELFAGDGLVAITNLVFPKTDSRRMSLHIEGGEADRMQFRLWNLSSAWAATKE